MITVTVSGNVGREPNRTDKGHVFFSVASKKKDKEGNQVTTWVDVAVFAKANLDTSKVEKGTYVTVTGNGSLETFKEKTSLKVFAKTLEVGFPVDKVSPKKKERHEDIPF